MLYASVIYSVLRRRRRSPRRFARTPPLWRLLLGELAEGLRRLGRRWRPRACSPPAGEALLWTTRREPRLSEIITTTSCVRKADQ